MTAFDVVLSDSEGKPVVYSVDRLVKEGVFKMQE